MNPKQNKDLKQNEEMITDNALENNTKKDQNNNNNLEGEGTITPGHKRISKRELIKMVLKMRAELEEIEKKIQTLRSNVDTTNVNNGNVNNGTVNITNNNKTQINNQINIIGFEKEDILKLDRNEIFRCLRL